MKERGIINDCPICGLEGRQGECPHSERARLAARVKLHGISLCAANEALEAKIAAIGGQQADNIH